MTPSLLQKKINSPPLSWLLEISYPFLVFGKGGGVRSMRGAAQQMKVFHANRKSTSWNLAGGLTGLWNPTTLRDSRWPLGQNKKSAVMAISWTMHSFVSGPKVALRQLNRQWKNRNNSVKVTNFILGDFEYHLFLLDAKLVV